MKTALLSMVHFYKRWISPALPGSCRFAPTCSAYALEAIEKHGSVKGSALTLGRLARCHPLNPGGWDPVPTNTKHNSRIQIPDSKKEGGSHLECGM